MKHFYFFWGQKCEVSPFFVGSFHKPLWADFGLLCHGFTVYFLSRLFQVRPPGKISRLKFRLCKPKNEASIRIANQRDG